MAFCGGELLVLEGDPKRELEPTGRKPVVGSYVGSAAGGAETAMGDVEVDDELVAGNEIGLVRGCCQVCCGVVDRRHVKSRREECVDAYALTGSAVDALEPAAVTAESELLRNQVRRGVDRCT